MFIELEKNNKTHYYVLFDRGNERVIISNREVIHQIYSFSMRRV